MTLCVVSGSGNSPLAALIGNELGVKLSVCNVERFPDGELRPTVGALPDADVYIIQPTGPPVNDHLVESLLLIDACRRAGAERITAVMPYLGYARQDRRDEAGQAVGAQVIARTITSSGADRVVVVDPHTSAIEALFDVPVEMLTAVPMLAEVLGEHIREDSVIVAPDLGAVKLAEHYGSRLDKTVVIVRKIRQSGSEVRVEEVIGDVEGRPVVIVDDMISTGATIRAAAKAVVARGALSDVIVAATHGLLLPQQMEGPRFPLIQRIFVTDSLPTPSTADVTLGVVSIAPLLADAIHRLHYRQSLDDLLMR
jgi:ribose-phosphate pyrophosphokinase